MIKSPIKYYSTSNSSSKTFDSFDEAIKDQEKLNTVPRMYPSGIYIGKRIDAFEPYKSISGFELDSGLVVQKEVGGCGVACVAMGLNVTYEKAQSITEELFPEWKVSDGLSIDKITTILRTKFEHVEYMTSDFLDLLPGRDAIVTVPSLNYPGLLHFIYIKDELVLDPSPGPLRYPKDSTNIDGKCVFPIDVIVWK